MSATDLSQYDLHFYGPMVMAAVERHAAVIDAAMKATRGNAWRSSLQSAVHGSD
jgi:hypothetical protein